MTSEPARFVRDKTIILAEIYIVRMSFLGYMKNEI